MFLANAANASRKDARGAVSGWSGATAYNPGQVLYRVAEVLEGRSAQFEDEIVRQEGVSAAAARPQVDEAIDRWIWYAGWTDKFTQVAGNANPVAGPYFNLTVPEPTGVVAIIAPAHRLTGSPAEFAPWLASHADVNTLDLVGAGALEWIDLEIAAADTRTRGSAEPLPHHRVHRDEDRLAHEGPDLRICKGIDTDLAAARAEHDVLRDAKQDRQLVPCSVLTSPE